MSVNLKPSIIKSHERGKKKMINFERIKSMSVEEMAVFIEKEMPNFGWLDECVVDCFMMVIVLKHEKEAQELIIALM